MPYIQENWAQSSSIALVGRKVSDASHTGGLQAVCSLWNDLHEISGVTLNGSIK